MQAKKNEKYAGREKRMCSVGRHELPPPPMSFGSYATGYRLEHKKICEVYI